VEGWGQVKKAARYAGISERTFRNWLKEGLKHTRLPTGTILIKYSYIDEYLESFSCRENEVERIVNETLLEFNLK